MFLKIDRKKNNIVLEFRHRRGSKMETLVPKYTRSLIVSLYKDQAQLKAELEKEKIQEWEVPSLRHRKNEQDSEKM